ncbi:MAG: DUF4349 domain-containing protein [Clostridia bacterium]|nr:DUF4349 domain-containing protein [Clostridia bacterium]
MKKFIIIIGIIALIIFPVGCSNNESQDTGIAYDMAMNGVSEERVTTNFNAPMNNEAASDDFGGINKLTASSAEMPEPQVVERKIIKSASMEIETLEYDSAVEKLNNKINSIGGYIESSNVRGTSINNRYDQRSAYFTIRIPEPQFLQFMSDMNTIGNIISENTYGEDITSSYFDTEAHVNTLEIQEERLLEILKKAEKVEDIIELERELANVRYEIESLTGTLRRWDNLVSFATLHVSLYEVIEITVKEEVPKTLSEKISQAFNNSIDKIKAFFENSLISGLGATPYLIFIIPGLIILIFIFHKIKKGYKNEKEKNVVIENPEEEKKE